MIYIKIFLFVLMTLTFRIEGSEKCDSQEEDYSSYVVISVIANNDDDRKYLWELDRKNIVHMWNLDLQIKIGSKNLMHVKQCNLNYLKNAFEKRNMKVFVASGNLQSLIDRQSPTFFSGNASTKVFNFAKYHQYDSIEIFLKDVTAKNKDISKLEIIGKSYEKRPLYSVRISLDDGKTLFSKIGGSIAQSKKQIILINCGMHAREWVSISFCLHFINTLTADFKKDEKKIVAVLRKYDFIIIPVMNPDGYVYSHSKGKYGRARLWRKTRSKIRGSRCIGADLNRNFYAPGRCDNNRPCTETYCGEKPLSEPEAAAFNNILVKTKGRLKAFFDIHSYGQFWLTPWAKPSQYDPEHYNEMIKVAKIGRKALEKRFNTKYMVDSASELMYPCHGTAMDYVYEKGFAKYSFTLELRDTGDCDDGECGFFLPPEKIVPTCLETGDGIVAAVLAMK